MARRVANRAGDVLLRALGRVGQRRGPARGAPRPPTRTCSRCRACCGCRCAACGIRETRAPSNSRSTTSSPPGPMAAGDDDRGRAHARESAAPPRARRSIDCDAAAAQRFGFRDVRRDDARARQQLRAAASARRRRRAGASPLVDTSTGSTTTSGRSSSSIAAATASTIAASASMPVLVAWIVDVAGDRFDLRGDEIGRQRERRRRRRRVFCAVIAVIALVP